jgi:hypothetical protein
MNFSRLEVARDYEVEKWFEELLKEYNVSAYHISRFKEQEVIRFAPFQFYKRRKIIKNNFLWRLTAPVFIIYCTCMIMAIPFKWLITGNRYLPQSFLIKFHYRWIEKMNW